MADVAVVIVNYRTPDLAVQCVESLIGERNTLARLRVVIVDGGSGDGSATRIASAIDERGWSDWVKLLPMAVNGGFGWANNQAILHLAHSAQQPEFVHLLNPDARAEPGAVVSLVDYLTAHPRVAAVGSQLLAEDGSLAGSAFSFPTIRGELARGARTGLIDKLLQVPPIAIHVVSAREVDWVTGGSVLLRLDALREVGLFDEGFFLYFEEVELMWRLRRAGWAIATEPRSRVIHVGGAATGVRDAPKHVLGSRQPRYLFRARSRFFGVTRGRAAAFAAYAAWLAGNSLWWARRATGLARGMPIDHQFRDHFRNAVPLAHDTSACAHGLDRPAGQPPTWMQRRWL